MALEGGQIIDGKYRIVRTIGLGGMGVVYEGENILIRRRVAIKVMSDVPGSDDAARLAQIERFEREAQAAGQIGSDHILEVLDLGTLASGDRYMVMEYLDGETLADRITRHIRLTPRQIAPIARQFLAALASAHAAGIIHRDLKPENIFILRSKAGRSDFVKLIDFGVSKFAVRPEGHRATRAGSLLGTPCYMSPEQARGRGEVDVRSDIYACGVILYEAVTGKLPFDGDSFNDLMFKIALEQPPSPLTIEPSLDPEFAWIIDRAMAREPTDRFQTVQDFSEKLDSWMRKNALTGTLALPLPAEAFPSRDSDAAIRERKEAPTAVDLGSLDNDVEVLERQVTSVDDSWARSQQITRAASSRRRNMIIALASAGGVALVITVIAAVSVVSSKNSTVAARSPDPTSTSTTTPSNTATVSPTTGSVASDEPSPTSPDRLPAATAATGAATTTSKSVTTTPTPSGRLAGGPRPKTSATGSAPRPKGSGSKFDFGY